MRAFVLLVCVLALAVTRPASACAVARRDAQIVNTAREDVLLVWDAARKVEHFVRRIAFESNDKSFGFLVPTPTKPELGEANDALFQQLSATTAPAIERRTHNDVTAGCLALASFGRGKGAPSANLERRADSVRVLGEQRVAGLDAAILQVEDTRGLETWLVEHGYPFRLALRKWIEPYVRGKWIITAFKYASREVAANGSAAALGVVTSNTLRMTFASDRPFYPYREPEDATFTPGRELRLFVLSNARLEGAFDHAGPWPVGIIYSKADANLSAVRAAMPGVDLAGVSWLTEIQDRSMARIAEDVYFKVAGSQAPVVPPPVVIDEPKEIFIPLEPFFVALAGGVFIVRRARRRSR